jgi:3-phenylpropionate/trans-cinnamate dioxygenase ferredoxin component
MFNWVEACSANDIEEEDVVRFDYGGRTFAIYRSPEDEYFATDGICTHEHAYLTDGLVMDNSSNALSTTAALTIRPARPRGRRSVSTSGHTRSRSRTGKS